MIPLVLGLRVNMNYWARADAYLWLLLDEIEAVLGAVFKSIPASRVAIHCHDTFGQALANIWTALQVKSAQESFLQFL